MRATAVLATVLVAGLGSGCTTFSDYNKATEDAREAFLRGEFALATEEYSDDLDAVNDSLLYHFEAALAAHVGGDYARSIELFDAAYEIVEEYQDRAIVSASDVAQTVGSILLNEKTIPYTGAVFEQLMMQSYQARNQYLKGDRESVLTDVLRSYRIQDKARRIYEAELKTADTQATSDAASAGIDRGEVTAKMRQAYDGRGDLSDAGDVYDPYYIRYLNAFLRDAAGERQADYNDAMLDLRRVVERFRDVEFIRRDMARMARLSGAGDVAQEYEATLSEPTPRGAGSLALFFEGGQAPRKEELKITFLTLNGAASIAIPLYQPIPDEVAGAELILGGRSARTVTFSNLESIAFRYFKDRLPLMIAKQIIRAAAKVGLQEGGHAVIKNQGKTSKNEGLVEILAFFWDVMSSIWNVVSEQADLRCWRTLPRTLQATRIYLPEGTYPAQLRVLGAGRGVLREVDLGSVTIKAGKHRLLNARALGSAVRWELAAEPYDAEPTGAPADGEPRVIDVLESDAPAAAEPAPTVAPVAESTGGAADPLALLRQRFPEGGPLCVTLIRKPGQRVSLNLRIASSSEGEDARGKFLALQTTAFRRGGRPYLFELDLRAGQILRADLIDAQAGRVVTKGEFAFAPSGEGQQREEDSGLHLAVEGRANAKLGSAEQVPASLHLRSWHRPDAHTPAGS